MKKNRVNRGLRASIALGTVTVLFGCGGGGGTNEPGNKLPDFVSGPVSQSYYDGESDDLLTAGLGLSGLMGPAPAFVDPANPTATELRRNAIYTNYRALIDFTAAGGFGSLYGPNIDMDGLATLGEGRVAGTEYIAYADNGTGRKNVAMMVQVPDSFDPSRACIVTGTSSGSRGLYGAIGTAGEWALKRGCAVAYTDKGGGNGLHDLMTDTVTRINGRLESAGMVGNAAHFRADVPASELSVFNAAFPHRVAFKHAHSQQNPEKEWGADTLDTIRFAFYVLNEQFAAKNPASGLTLRQIVPANTVVIASSVSNGAGAALAAAEQDTEGLIDGVAVSEPNITVRDNAGLSIRQGGSTVVTHSKPLADYFSFANVFQPCAVLSDQAGLSLVPAFWPDVFTTASANRCQALRDKGLLSADTLAGQADEALARLHNYGWQTEHDYLQQSHFRFATNAIVMTYVNTYGRFSVTDNVCGFSFANTDALGGVVAQNPVLQASIFSTGNGVPPTSGVNIVYNDSVGGARLDFLAVSPSTGVADFALDGALCMRALVTGTDPVSGATLTGDMKADSDRVRAGIDEVLASGDLNAKPAIIVTGRNDTLIPPNHASRAYYGKNRMTEGSDSQLRYVEVTNAQHFDTFIGFGPLLGYDARFVPLHYYFGQAMDLMYGHLTEDEALPPSQVVRTTPRGAGAEPISLTNVPSIQAEPASGDRIEVVGAELRIPD